MHDGFFERFEAETTYSRDVVREYRRRGYWGGLSLGEYLDVHADERAEDVAAIDDDASVTWGELRDRVDEIAAGLQSLGLERGTRIAFQVPAGIEWLALRLGISRAGGISVPVYPRFGRQEIEHVVETVEPFVYVCSDDSEDGSVADSVVEMRESVDALEHAFTVGETGEGIRQLDELRGSTEGFSPERIDPDLPDLLALSSGTTGLPKIYYVVQNTYLSTAKDVMGRCSVSEYDTVMTLAPVQQAFGHIVSIYLSLASGATISMTATNDPVEQWRRISADEPAFVGAIPTQTAKLMNSEVAEEHTLRFVRSWVNGGAPLPTEVAEWAEEKGATIVNGYGAGDGGWATTARPMDPRRTRIQTVGPRHPAMRVDVIDDDGDPLPTGEVGEVVMRGGGCCFGYFDDRERTEEVFDVGGPREGWFHSSDAGSIDEQGNLTIVGRLDDMILRGGQNVYPAEIEDVLIGHEAVAEAAVIGVPDRELGERVGAYIVEASGSSVTHDEIVEWFESKGLATFKWPERVETVDELPRSPGGKIKKSALREDVEEKLREEGRLD